MKTKPIDVILDRVADVMTSGIIDIRFTAAIAALRGQNAQFSTELEKVLKMHCPELLIPVLPPLDYVFMQGWNDFIANLQASKPVVGSFENYMEGYEGAYKKRRDGAELVAFPVSGLKSDNINAVYKNGWRSIRNPLSNYSDKAINLPPFIQGRKNSETYHEFHPGQDYVDYFH